MLLRSVPLTLRQLISLACALALSTVLVVIAAPASIAATCRTPGHAYLTQPEACTSLVMTATGRWEFHG
ncbi:hypothetical protein D0T12_07470 [Actinomadura spongiicola]|uniref:Uncharacterized protein n=1 Tax=Actinomadura spongiicola TaxID=2303421 RepID=A0A372GM24_9ACTN|nr:hypothetical protein [Actinomadura spongiicola]RFS86418.1 hypothetical protein D0T12_07470 [Actinomadura spongiicola]